MPLSHNGPKTKPSDGRSARLAAFPVTRASPWPAVRGLAAVRGGLPPPWAARPAGLCRQAGRSQRTPSGGMRRETDAGRPCHGTFSACTSPRLPTPDPP